MKIKVIAVGNGIPEELIGCVLLVARNQFGNLILDTGSQYDIDALAALSRLPAGIKGPRVHTETALQALEENFSEVATLWRNEMQRKYGCISPMLIFGEGEYVEVK